MPKKKYRRYSPEYKRHALKRSSEDGITDREVCADLGISERQLRRWGEDDWNVLWEDLHHQGDVGEASYAVVPYLTEYAKSASQIAWHAFGFAAIVELERTEHDNPEVPEEIRQSYFASIRELPKIALDRGADAWDKYCFEPVMACLALSLDHREHARAYLELTESEISEFFKYYYGETD